MDEKSRLTGRREMLAMAQRVYETSTDNTFQEWLYSYAVDHCEKWHIMPDSFEVERRPLIIKRAK